MNPAPNLILVGPMGAGKSCIGRRLAERFTLEFIDADQAIVEAGHSDALATLYGAIGELLRRSHVQRRAVTVSEPGIVEYLVEAHREVFLSIMDRDADAADRKLRDHFAIGDEFRRRSLISAFTREPQG